MVGPPKKPGAGISEAAGGWAVSTFTPAHLRRVHADTMDRAHVDARPARRGGDIDALLPDRAALQGRPLPPHLRHGLRRLRRPRALLAPLAATGLIFGARSGDPRCAMIFRSIAPTRRIGGMDRSGFCDCCTTWFRRGLRISTRSSGAGAGRPCSTSDAAAASCRKRWREGAQRSLALIPRRKRSAWPKLTPKARASKSNTRSATVRA